jgi:hypothetical protein
VRTAQLRERYLETARDCLVEAERTLDPEAAEALRKLAERFFDEAERYARAQAVSTPTPYRRPVRAEWRDDPGAA